MLVVTRNDKALRKPIKAFLGTEEAPDGFYLNEGPNGDRMTRETRRQRLERLFEESGDDPDSFTLF